MNILKKIRWIIQGKVSHLIKWIKYPFSYRLTRHEQRVILLEAFNYPPIKNIPWGVGIPWCQCKRPNPRYEIADHPQFKDREFYFNFMCVKCRRRLISDVSNILFTTRFCEKLLKKEKLIK